MRTQAVDWPARDLVSHRARATPERTALIDAATGRQWSYRAYDQAVDRLLAQRPVFGDGPIGLLLEPGPTVAVALFAAMRTGTTAVPLAPTETPAVLGSAAERVGLEAICCERATASLAADLGVDRVVTVDDAVLGPADRSATAVGGDVAPVEPTRLERSTRALVLFTSGTTGEPKGVQLTVGNLVASATASAFRLGVSPDDRWLCCLPTSHMGGLAPIVRSALYGTTVVIQQPFDPTETAAVLEEYEITGISLVPTMLTRLLDAGWTPPESLRVVLLGGAPTPPAVIERCAERDVPVFPTYGSTETASQITTARPTEAVTNPESVGQPLVCTEVTIVDDDGQPLERGKSGEIVVDGPTVTPGYLSAEHTTEAIGDHGFHTGDIGRLDADGRLTVTGRLDDRIITGGENVDPNEVVAVLRDHPAVEDAAVVGLPDEEWGERVAALVVGDVTADDLDDHCQARLAGFKRPKTICVVDTLPRTASGTIDRGAVRECLRT